MPKSPKQHLRHGRRLTQRRRNERHTDEKDLRESLPRDGKCTSIADTRTLSHAVSCKVQEDREYPMRSAADDIRAATGNDGAANVVDEAHCDVKDCLSLCLSEASTFVSKADDHIFAGIPQDAYLEDVEFEFDTVVQIDGDQCLVRWADSNVRTADLYSRFLHNVPLLQHVAHSRSLGGNISKVSWKLTWEPVSILQYYTDVVRRDSQFDYGDIIKESAGYSLIQWNDSVIHESTLEILQGHPPLRDQVRSVSCSQAHDHVQVEWKPMWLPANIMEG